MKIIEENNIIVEVRESLGGEALTVSELIY